MGTPTIGSTGEPHAAILRIVGGVASLLPPTRDPFGITATAEHPLRCSFGEATTVTAALGSTQA